MECLCDWNKDYLLNLCGNGGMFIGFIGFLIKNSVNFVGYVMLINLKIWFFCGCFIEKLLNGKFCVFDLESNEVFEEVLDKYFCFVIIW